MLGGGTALAADPTPTPMPTISPNGSDTVLGRDKAKDYVCIALPINIGKQSTIGTQGKGRCEQPGTYEVANDGNGGAIIAYLVLFLQLLNLLVGAVIVLVIVIAGVQYVTSAGDPTNTKKAKGRITAAITALIVYMLMNAALNFLIPGGGL